MPRFVVPILVPELADSRSASSSRCSGQDQRHVVSDAKIVPRDRDALALQLLDLGGQRIRVEHDAVADNGQLARPHDARRQKGQLVDILADDQRMAGIVAALEADDRVGLLGQPVDQLALALVAPLGANHDYVRHLSTLRAGRYGRDRCLKRKTPAYPQVGHPGLAPECYPIAAGA